VNKIIFECSEELFKLSKAESAFVVFWLLGPFLLLIERTPGDAWISIIGIAFLVRSMVTKNFGWLRVFWVRAAFAFWVACIVSSVVSNDMIYSIGEAVVWFRFPLFAMAVAFWLGINRKVQNCMLLSLGCSLCVMFAILSMELLIQGHGNVGNRLGWPYGDYVSGNFIAKAGLPFIVFCASCASAVERKYSFMGGMFFLLSVIFVTLTGERINTLIVVCGGVLAMLVSQVQLKRIVASLFSILVVLGVVAISAPYLFTRFTVNFVEQLPTSIESSYVQAIMPGFLAFQQFPFLGIGTANLRNLCETIVPLGTQMKCYPHPHNYYVQLLGETGLIGFVLGTIFLFSIVWHCFCHGRVQKDRLASMVAWVVPFALFWPIASTADFFGQWNNVFMWSGIALATAISSNGRVSKIGA